MGNCDVESSREAVDKSRDEHVRWNKVRSWKGNFKLAREASTGDETSQGLSKIVVAGMHAHGLTAQSVVPIEVLMLPTGHTSPGNRKRHSQSPPQEKLPI